MRYLVKFLLNIVTISAIHCLRVDLTYGSTFPDSMDFWTKDKTVCERYNAHFVKTKKIQLIHDIVVCTCNAEEIFFGLNGDVPKCREENYGLAYGCGCDSKVCSTTLKDVSKVLLAHTTIPKSCNKTIYRVGLWNGKDYRLINNDFDLFIDPKTKPGYTTATLKWNLNTKPVYTQYKGRFIKIFMFCDGNTTHPFCMVLKGVGTFSLSVDEISITTTATKTSTTTQKSTETTTTTTTTTTTPTTTKLSTTKTKAPKPPPSPVSTSSDDSSNDGIVLILTIVAVTVFVILLGVSVIFCHYSHVLCFKRDDQGPQTVINHQISINQFADDSAPPRYDNRQAQPHLPPKNNRNAIRRFPAELPPENDGYVVPNRVESLGMFRDPNAFIMREHRQFPLQ